ncbi:MAG: YqgE/AlgH family protein [Rhodobacterales bacterium]|nr:MAG: YqgE/AlgH family protein [Rhodobacterales bacterium]
MDTPLNLSGQMLIAMPSLNDPRFEHAVVFLCDHSEQGAMGLIVNKAVPGMSLANLLEEMDISSSEGINQTEIYFGGPVEGGRGFVLHNPGFEGTGTVMVNDHFSLTATRDILEAMATGNGPEQVLVALGYAGWGPGQLENELKRNDWLTTPAEDAIVFNADPGTKWHQALAAMGIDPVLLSAEGGTA